MKTIYILFFSILISSCLKDKTNFEICYEGVFKGMEYHKYYVFNIDTGYWKIDSSVKKITVVKTGSNTITINGKSFDINPYGYYNLYSGNQKSEGYNVAGCDTVKYFSNWPLDFTSLIAIR